MAPLQFFAHEQAHLGGRLHGAEQRWLVPLAYFDTAQGFGESVWLPSLPVTMLAMRLAGAPVRRCWGRGSIHSGHSRQIALQPRGTPNHYEALGRIRFAQLILPDHLIDRAARSLNSDLTSGRLRDDLAFLPDERLHRLTADYIHRAIDIVHNPSTLEMEARALLVVERLVQLHGGAAANPRGGLSPSHLRKATDLLTERLHEDVPLAELAAQVELSPFHFCRAFKLSTGTPPHRWQIARRIERACDLLVATQMSITDIAAAVGYEDPGQFATVFRRTMNHTPSQYRNARRS